MSYLQKEVHLSVTDGSAEVVQACVAQAKTMESEAEKYLKLPDEPSNVDVLQWWSDHEKDYPNLSKLACQFLSVPASSASAPLLLTARGTRTARCRVDRLPALFLRGFTCFKLPT